MGASSSVKGAERAVTVLRFLASRVSPVLASTVSRECDIPRSSTYHLLNVLADAGFVTYYPDERRWGLGLAVFEIGTAYLLSEPLERLSRPTLARIAAETGLVAGLYVLDGSEVVILQTNYPDQAQDGWVDIEVGHRLPAHVTAAGRAMLMHVGRQRLATLYPSMRLGAVGTGNGPLELHQLRNRLREHLAVGYAAMTGELDARISAIAAPVFGAHGHTVASIGVTYERSAVPTSRVPQVAGRIVAAAANLSARMGYAASAAG